ncbi:hypothetical protein OGATHE_002843 [Ogataea polymorpha]|uniref:Uncharacterized protein n=1 Tax=Ogataea polymorpha TaxID=460523 RepID=A0A9P8PED6_9ASCO|nr:hypothetical protein OGATHE_002843 [Ogataea polymorpha]
MKSCSLYIVSSAFSLSRVNSARLSSRSPWFTSVSSLIRITRTSSYFSWISFTVAFAGTSSSHSNSSDTISRAARTIDEGPLATTFSSSVFLGSRVQFAKYSTPFGQTVLLSSFLNLYCANSWPASKRSTWTSPNVSFKPGRATTASRDAVVSLKTTVMWPPAANSKFLEACCTSSIGRVRNFPDTEMPPRSVPNTAASSAFTFLLSSSSPPRYFTRCFWTNGTLVDPPARITDSTLRSPMAAASGATMRSMCSVMYSSNSSRETTTLRSMSLINDSTDTLVSLLALSTSLAFSALCHSLFMALASLQSVSGLILV